MGIKYSSCCGKKAQQQAFSIERKSIQNTTANDNDSRQTQNVETKPLTEFHASRQDFIKNKSTDFNADYDLKERIGLGTYGEVKRAIDKKANEERAVKIIRKSEINPKEYGKLMEEVKIIIALDHPNILKIYDVYEDNDKYYIVTDYLRGGELFDRIIKKNHISEQVAARIMKQVLSAVAYCHKHGVAHRDLKPENILFESPDSENINIIDFGLAQTFRPHQRLHGLFGTSYYVAPEVIDSDYSEKCDIWSCGVILYVMLSGEPPFTGKEDDDADILEVVKKGQYDFSHHVWDNVSQEAKSFIRKMMEIDPNKRYSAEQALQDPWLNKYSGVTQFDQPLTRHVLNRLSSFRVETKLQEAIWIFLVSHFSTKEDLHNLWQAFKALDLNNDGQLTKEELVNAYVKVDGMSNHRAEEEAQRILDTLDTDHDGRVNYSEFLSAAASRKIMLTKDHLESAFKIFDKDGDGEISADDLKLLFNNENIQKFPSDLCQKLIADIDVNHDGKISLEEFKNAMLSLLHTKSQIDNIIQDFPSQR